MKTTILMLAQITLCYFNSWSQPSLQWNSTVQGPVVNGKGTDIVLDAQGNSYVTGYSEGIKSGRDFMTIKYSPNGDKIWTKNYNGTANGNDEAVAVKEDVLGNVYVIGESEGTGTGLDIVTVKYNSNGDTVWTRRYNGSGNKDDVATDFVVDHSGNVYVVGSAFRSAGNYTDGILVKYDSNGIQPIEETFFDLGNNDVANKVSINTFGNLVVANYLHITDSHGDYNPSEDAFVIYELDPVSFAIKYKYGFSGDKDNYSTGYPHSMLLDNEGNIYVSSSEFTDPVSAITSKYEHGKESLAWWNSRTNKKGNIIVVDSKIDAEQNIYVLTQLNDTDYYLIKYSKDGKELWVSKYFSGNRVNDAPVSICLNNASRPDIYVAGYNSTGDIQVVKVNNDGKQIWAVSYQCGNGGVEVASKMVIDRHENIFITGSSNCNNEKQEVNTIKYCANVPSVAIKADDHTNIPEGNSVKLSVKTCPECSYIWSTGSTDTSIVVSPDVKTSYWVRVSKTQGCDATASLVVAARNNSASIKLPSEWQKSDSNSTLHEVPDTNSINIVTDLTDSPLIVKASNEFSNGKQINVHPNPAKDILMINCSGFPEAIYDVKLIDQMGKAIIGTSIQSNSQKLESQLDIKNIPTGWYYLTIQSEEVHVVTKVIKI